MIETSLLRGTLLYQKNGENVLVNFYYPEGLSWYCVECGTCCGDVKERKRMILLLPEDIKRIKKLGEEDFYEEWNDEKFKGIMRKKNGKCVFYNKDRCRIYKNRALLCRMYPFWLEKKQKEFIFGVDLDCPGLGTGKLLDEEFYQSLLNLALNAMNY